MGVSKTQVFLNSNIIQIDISEIIAINIYRRLYRYLTNLFEPKPFTKHIQTPQNIMRNRPKFKYAVSYIVIIQQKTLNTLPPCKASLR